MLNNIIKFSLNNKYLIFVSLVLLVVMGTRTTINMDECISRFYSPTVVVMTDAHVYGIRVEQLVFSIETSVNSRCSRGAFSFFTELLFCLGCLNLIGELIFSKARQIGK